MSHPAALPYKIYDVFTDTAYTGNPLAVVEGGAALSTPQMQRIAAEFNLSETVFILPAETASQTARLRIFTPKKELPFAGHPTVGASVALHEDGHGTALSLGLAVGCLAATIDARGASIAATQPLEILAKPAPELVAAALGLPHTALSGAPVLASMGVPFVFAPLSTRTELTHARAEVAAMRAGLAAHPESTDFALVPYLRTENRVDMRMFAPLDGIPEDPATGSAAVALSRLLWSAQADDAPLRLALHQGDDMGRPSLIETHTDADRVTLTGRARLVMRGEILALPDVP